MVVGPGGCMYMYTCAHVNVTVTNTKIRLVRKRVIRSDRAYYDVTYRVVFWSW